LHLVGDLFEFEFSTHSALLSSSAVTTKEEKCLNFHVLVLYGIGGR